MLLIADWPWYMMLGMTAGLLAGLFGIGGGAIMVPVLTILLEKAGVAATEIVHIALGTSMAAIVPTALASVWSHHRRGGVRWEIFLRMLPGVLMGTIIGVVLAVRMASIFLAIIFMLYVLGVSIHLWRDHQPRAMRELPGVWMLSGVGAFIGGFSSWVAIGGGTLTVPFLLWCRVPLRQAIGTSSAVGLPLALCGTIGYGLANPGQPSLDGQVGYVYGVAVMWVTLASVLMAPIGAWLAHRLPAMRLKRMFAG
ncbi:MAG: sulfite exporter TauE/SafE family protein, partial [Gammaproteobacteria bacterium]